MRGSLVREVIAVAAVLVTASILEAGETTPSPFFVAPLATDLHRTLISKHAHVYAMFDCSSLTRLEGPIASAPSLRQFESELKRFSSAERDHLHLVLRYSSSDEASAATRAAIKTSLATGIAHSAGFTNVRTVEMSTSQSWEEQLQPLGEFEESDKPNESIFDDNQIKAYPIRTRLSKLALSDADCVVRIKRPFDGRQDDLPDELRSSIAKAVRSLELEDSQGKLAFHVSSTTAGQPTIDRIFSIKQRPTIPPEIKDPALRGFFEKQVADYRPSPAMKLALELGFKSIGCSHSPGGGAPEKLIGRAAPNFTLQSLDGKSLELASFRKGRPALVTFWGVACGPCCEEAPHLTRMHAKYADRLAIVAVNGYDESQETVAAFVEKAKLHHPIVLNGEKLADGEYFVGAYPTTFWISADGTVVDYEVGFESAEALEARVKSMIGE
jgi:thiol-disulfide isomerase/thioredoxin